MIVNLPAATIDSLVKFFTHTAGYLRTVEVDIIFYKHLQGTIAIRAIDNAFSEVWFSDPTYPDLTDVLPVGKAIRMKSENLVSGTPFPEYAITKQKDEYNRRLANKQAWEQFLTEKFNQEMARIREQAAAQASPMLPQSSAPGEIVASAQSPSEEFSYLDILCLKWAGRDPIAYRNMDYFLKQCTDPDHFISKDQFKILLQEAGNKGILEKQGRYWKPAPGIIRIGDRWQRQAPY